MVVLLFTVIVILVLNSFDYLKEMANVDEDDSMVELFKNSSTSATENENDIKHVVSTLEKTKKKLVEAVDRENKLTQEKTELVSKMLKIQVQLDESLADNMILKADLTKLETQMNSKNDVVVSHS